MCLSPLVASCWTSRNLEFILGCGGWEDPQRARLSTHDVAGSIGRETQGPAPKKLGFLKCGSSNQVLAHYTRLPAVYPSLIKYGCPICNPGCEVLWQASRGDVNRQNETQMFVCGANPGLRKTQIKIPWGLLWVLAFPRRNLWVGSKFRILLYLMKQDVRQHRGMKVNICGGEYRTVFPVGTRSDWGLHDSGFWKVIRYWDGL